MLLHFGIVSQTARAAEFLLLLVDPFVGYWITAAKLAWQL